MTRHLPVVVLVALMSATPSATPRGQSLRIGIVDFYGLGRVPEAAARSALVVKEGDSVDDTGATRPAFLAESERRLARVAGVRRAHVDLVCCEEGSGILYVGIEEKDAPVLRFREPPRGSVRLPPEMVESGEAFVNALMAAVRRGDAGEDLTKGHSLMHDPAARAVQERFIEYARNLTPVRDVLRQSSDATHRTLAAQILGYAANKRDVIEDLVYGMNDSSADVRNAAMRALSVIARAAPVQSTPVIPIEPFIRLIGSPSWSDRNKASLALLGLTDRRDPQLLRTLKMQAMVSLVDMTRWRTQGHAMPGLLVLGRIAGLPDEETWAAWTRGDRGFVINAARERR
jgi:hypothetical protein